MTPSDAPAAPAAAPDAAPSAGAAEPRPRRLTLELLLSALPEGEALRASSG